MRNTVARTEILNLIINSRVALSHAEIESALNGLCNRVTIYRVLDRLEEENLVHKIINVDGHLKFSACHKCEKAHHDHHLHFSCIACGDVTCLEDVEPSFQLPGQYSPVFHSVQELSVPVQLV